MLLQQPQRPPRVPGRRGRARQRDQPGLDLAGHLRGHRRELAFLPLHRGPHIATGLGEPFGDQPHRLTRDPSLLSYHHPVLDRARRITDAGCTPVRVTRSSASRSSAANVTGYFFCDGMTTSCLAKGEGTSARSQTATTKARTSCDTLLAVVCWIKMNGGYVTGQGCLVSVGAGDDQAEALSACSGGAGGVCGTVR